MNLQNKYGPSGSSGVPDGSRPVESKSEKKEWYDFTLLNLFVKYYNKAKAEGKI